MTTLKEEIFCLYSEPPIGASYLNTYGEENIKSLIEKYKRLNGPEVQTMMELVKEYSKSGDLNSCFVSVAVLHGLGMTEEVDAAYCWAESQDDPQLYTSHFDIGKAIAQHLGFA